MEKEKGQELRLSIWDIASAGCIIAIALACTAHIWHSEFTYTDAARHAMDGVFVRDFLTEGNWRHPVQYALEYYGRYPAIAFLLYYPPVYALYEAPFFMLSGVNLFAVRLAAIVSLIAVGLLWYFWLARDLGRRIALAACAISMTSVGFVRWSGEAMLEIPALALLTACAIAYRAFLRVGGAWRLILAALFLGLAIGTKQTAGFLLLALIAAPFVLGGKEHFSKRSAIAALGVFLVLVAPLAIVTWRFGAANIAAASGVRAMRLWGAENWLACPRFLSTTQLSPVLALLGALGAALALAKRDRRALFLVLWAGANYLAFSLLAYKSSRLSMFWIPAVAALGLYGVRELGGADMQRTLKKAVFVLLALYHLLYLGHNGRLYTVRGYRDAAQYVSRNPKGATVFVQAFHNGNFIFHMREFDKDRKAIILRSSKVLAAHTVMPQFGTKVYMDTEEKILTFLKRHGAGYVVIEDRAVGGEDTSAYRMLRRMVGGKSFQLSKSIAVESNHPYLMGLRLNIYEFLDREALTEDAVEIELLSIGRKVRIPLRR
ncbi:MAG: ArnT family glycosyltransferase [Alphaproteobacteria bacterium]